MNNKSKKNVVTHEMINKLLMCQTDEEVFKVFDYYYKNEYRIIGILNQFCQKFPMKASEVQQFYDLFDMYRENNKLIDKKGTVYYKKVKEIINCQSEEEALKLIRKINVEENRNVKVLIDRYAKVFPEEEDNIKKLLELYDKYIFEYFPKIKKELYSEKSTNNKYLIIINELLNTSDVNMWISILKENKIPVSKFKIYLEGYKNRFPDKTNNHKRLKEIYDEYAKYSEQERIKREQELKKQRAKERVAKEKATASLAKEIVLLFVNSNLQTVKDFCVKNNIKEVNFNKYIKIIKTHEEDVYQLYQVKIDNIKKQRFAKVIDKVSQVVDGLKNGVKVDDENTRPFDLLDYYLTTKLTFEELSQICGEMRDHQAIRLIKMFVSKNKNNNFIQLSDILSTTNCINGHEVTTEEKNLVLDFLNKNNIPLYAKIYSLALKRYLSGELKIEPIIEDKTKSK